MAGEESKGPDDKLSFDQRQLKEKTKRKMKNANNYDEIEMELLMQHNLEGFSLSKNDQAKINSNQNDEDEVPPGYEGNYVRRRALVD